MTRHMPIEQWDKEIAPLLGVIKLRCGWVRVDANQIMAWVKELAAVPNFDTEAFDAMQDARAALQHALSGIEASISAYEKKEKVT